MKKVICIILLIVFSLYILFFVGTGLRKQQNIVLVDYSVSEDGTILTIKTGNMSSMGYIRGFVDNVEDGIHYLTFYSTFGGLNSKLGAKSEFEIMLNEDDVAIYFQRTEGQQLVLEKNLETDLWQYPNGKKSFF